MDYTLVILLVVPLIGSLVGAFLPERVAGKGWGIGVSLSR
jgi:hypothetical protein